MSVAPRRPSWWQRNISKHATWLREAGLGGASFALALTALGLGGDMTLISIVLLAAWVVGSIALAMAPEKSRFWKIGTVVALSLFFLTEEGSLYWHFRKPDPSSATPITPTTEPPAALPQQAIKIAEPKLGLYVVYTIFGQAEVNNKKTPSMFIFLKLSNTGDVQTSVTDYRVYVKTTGATYPGTVVAPTKPITVEPMSGNGNKIIVHPEDALFNKTISPIRPGEVVYGFLMVYFETVPDYLNLMGGVEIYIVYLDGFSKFYYQIAIPRFGSSTIQWKEFPRIVLPGMRTEFP
jgi:hypothetical protein